MTVLIGGVSELYQSDLDLGRHAIERLREEELGSHVVVEELHYGAVAVTQRLDELKPTSLVVIGTVERGREPGAVVRRRIDAPDDDPAVVREAVADAAVGYVSIDLLITVAAGLGSLPARIVTIEVEPAQTGPGDGLSALGEQALEQVVDQARIEARRAPLLELADRARDLLAEDRLEPSPGLEALELLVDGLATLESEGTWAATFMARDRLRLRIAGGETSDGMDHLDWVVCWGLIEELDRLQPLEVG